MRLAIGSIFRNSEDYLGRYFEQAGDLRERLAIDGHTLQLILVEGDSTDYTWDKLHECAAGFDAQIIKREHRGLPYGSVDVPQRWRQISYACNGVLEAVPYDVDVFVWVESDIIWNVSTMLDLIKQLTAVSAVSPMCFGPDGRFYDVWGFRKDGENFSKDKPYHTAVNGEVTEIDSAGSCIVMRADIARQCRFEPAELGIVGFCESIWAAGYSLMLDPTLQVNHP